jgi:hypothetical protein
MITKEYKISERFKCHCKNCPSPNSILWKYYKEQLKENPSAHTRTQQTEQSHKSQIVKESNFVAFSYSHNTTSHK